MTPQANAQSAYAMLSTPTRTPRGIEYAAFSRATSRLRAAADTPGASGRIDLARAVHENRRLWTALAADVADAGNGLPQRLRAQLFWLSDFTDRHSRRVLDEGADPAVLVEINTSVMRGLAGDGGAP